MSPDPIRAIYQALNLTGVTVPVTLGPHWTIDSTCAIGPSLNFDCTRPAGPSTGPMSPDPQPDPCHRTLTGQSTGHSARTVSPDLLWAIDRTLKRTGFT